MARSSSVSMTSIHLIRMTCVQEALLIHEVPNYKRDRYPDVIPTYCRCVSHIGKHYLDKFTRMLFFFLLCFFSHL